MRWKCSVLLICLSFGIRWCLGAGMVGISLGNTWRMGNMTALKTALLHNYDESTTPPGFTGSDRGTNIEIQLGLNQFPVFDTVNEAFSMFAWWRYNWKDLRLTWNPEDWDDITYVVFKYGTDIWVPDTTVYASTESNEVFHDLVLVTVYYNGDVNVSRPIVSAIPCAMQLEGFPWDTQTCTFTFGSWALDVSGVSVSPKSFISSNGTIIYAPFVFTSDWDHLTEFQLETVKTVHDELFYGSYPKPFSTINYSMKLRRIAVSYTWGIILPLVLITLSGFGAFIVNPDAGERIGFGVTIILATAAIYIVADNSLPKAKHMTHILVLYAVSILMSVVTLLVSIVNSSLYCVRNSDGLFTESSLLKRFIEADKDQSGDLDKDEIVEMLMEMGLPQIKIDVFLHVVEQKNDIFDDTGYRITFPQWYDMVEIVADIDHFSDRHSPLISAILRPFLEAERKHRKEFVVRRAEIAIQRNLVSNNIAVQPDLGIKKRSISASLRRRKKTSTSPKVKSRHSNVLGVGNAAQENALPTKNQAIGMKVSPGPSSIHEDDAIAIGIEMMGNLDNMVETVADDVTGADSNVSTSTDGVPRESLTDHVTDDITRPDSMVPKGKDDVPYESEDEAHTLMVELTGRLSDSNTLKYTNTVPDEKGGANHFITSYELSDPSERVARRLAGHIDFICVAICPIAYIVFLFCLFASNMSFPEEFKGTRFEHVALDGTVSSFCCFGKDEYAPLGPS